MRLDELTAGIAGGAWDGLTGGSVEIGELAYDSRHVRPGALFFCVSGFQSDGHDFAPDAVAAGAAALVCERRLALEVPQLIVPSARAAMGPIAVRFFGDPSSRLRVVGITGTNGKTTTAYLVRALLQACGMRCGLLGTVTSIVAGEERPVTRTTPEAVDLQRDLREMLDGGDRACAMEVSSHALELGRSDGVRFAAGVFTNLSRDHLDFHPTMEDYFRAKRHLFVGAHQPGVSLIGVGDDYGRRLAAELPAARTFAVQERADYSATELRCDFQGCRFRLGTPAGERVVALPLPGRFNVANALGALATAHELGGELDALVAALERGTRVPGRFEPVLEGQDFAVLVDYAHTPASLENVLRSARELAATRESPSAGRVLCVFGAGGDRDRGKRPLMGEVGARLSDVALITSDNPRSEDPEQIIAEVMAGARRVRGAHARSVVERAAAIEQAIEQARAGDVVVIAGKGHEQGQELAAGRKIPFDDVDVARRALRSAQARRAA